MDVWFDSGISWSSLPDSDAGADIYLEGIDQVCLFSAKHNFSRVNRILHLVFRVVLLLAPDERRLEGKSALQEDPRARLHRRRDGQEDVQVHRERGQPRPGEI